MLKETHAVDYVGQSFPEVGWYGKTCLYSLWILLMKSAVRIWWVWNGLDVFFPSLRNQHQQHRTTAQNTSNQLAQCNFHHACSCMGSVLFSNMLKETHTADYVGQSFPEVGWYGKTCLFSLWTLVVKSAVRIWIGLDGFFPSLTSQPTSSTTQPHKIPENNLRNAIFTMFVLAWVLFCFPLCWKKHMQWIMLAKVFPRLVGTVKFVCFLCEFWWWKMQFYRIWIGLDVFFFIAHFATNKQYHTTAQNTSKQLAQCNFHHACSCMGSVLFSNMLKDTHTADYVGQSFPEVGWYGKTCLFSLWTLVVKSAVRIWIGLDGFFPSLTSQPTPAAPHNRTKYQQTTCAMQFSPCLFLHSFSPVFHAERDTYSRLCWPKFSIRLVGTVKFVCFLCEFWWWKVQLEYG